MKQLFTIAFVAFSFAGFAQNAQPVSSSSVSNKLNLKQGQKLEVVTNMINNITQEVMGNEMEMKIQLTATSSYDVTEATEATSTLEHNIRRVQMTFDGMGQSRTIDSDNEKDMKSDEGREFKKALKNKYTMKLDASGKVLDVVAAEDNPHKSKKKADAEAMAALSSQFSMDGFLLPQIGEKSVFSILPDGDVTIGTTWNTSKDTKDNKRKATFKVTNITATDVIVEFNEEANVKTVQENMGMQIYITKKDVTVGTMKIDRASGILKESTAIITTIGNAEVMGQEMPLKAKSTMVTTVKSL